MNDDIIETTDHDDEGEVSVDVLVIDDLRTFPRMSAEYARTSEEGIARLASRQWGEVWLDHDLGEGDDIMAVVEYLEWRWHRDEDCPVSRAVVHSANPVGAANVVRALERFVPTTRINVFEIEHTTAETFSAEPASADSAPTRPQSPSDWVGSTVIVDTYEYGRMKGRVWKAIVNEDNEVTAKIALIEVSGDYTVPVSRLQFVCPKPPPRPPASPNLGAWALWTLAAFAVVALFLAQQFDEASTPLVIVVGSAINAAWIVGIPAAIVYIIICERA